MVSMATPSPRQRVPVPGTLRARIVAAATQVTVDTGWSSVTMGRLADMVGISRQTVYNEIGGKRQLAEEIMFTELNQFLTVINEAFEAHPDNLVAAVRQACHDVLVLAGRTTLLQIVISASHGAEHDLLPLLTTQSQPIIETTKDLIRERCRPYVPDTPARELDATIDVIVRTVLSHVMQPSATPEQTADDIALIVERVVAGAAVSLASLHD